MRYPDLTRRQQDIISFFADYVEYNGYPPTRSAQPLGVRGSR
jgi:SOS-response transcriptional repressor LexA